MKISAKTEYACLALMELARLGSTGQPVRVRDLAEAHGIPERYLVQILLQLKGAGLVASARGTSGGYQLMRPAREISVADVMRLMEGSDSSHRQRSSAASLIIADILDHAARAYMDVLRGTSIADLNQRFGSNHDWVL
jgi:Rrf2 family protein